VRRWPRIYAKRVPRDLPIGNGSLLVNFDREYQLRDIYYPRVGQENHTAGDACRFGVWAGGQFAWLSDDGWARDLRYQPDTLVTAAVLTHRGLQLTITCNDAVDLGRDLLIRQVQVRNDGLPREVRVFFHYDWHIYGTPVGDTVMYYPPIKALVAYKGHRYFAAGVERDGTDAIDAYACGKKEIDGAQGTWRDAEDGQLGNNPIEQGSVDMTLGVHLGTLPSGASCTLYQWLVAAHDLSALQNQAGAVRQRSARAFLERTRAYWSAWVQKGGSEFGDLAPPVVEFYRRSLLILRTQIDNRGAIVAANDAEIVKFARDTYSYMWPRDGALAAYAMDQAGYLEVSRQFFELCARIITPEGFFLHKYTPAGELGSSWHPWVDPAGKLQYPIQEDETGLVLFALWHHYAVHRDFEFVKTYYRGLIVRAADFLARYLDPATHLPQASYDLWEERRGIMSFTVAAVWAGLQAAANFAELYGEVSLAARYRETAASIQAAARRSLVDPRQNRFLRALLPQGAGRLDPDPVVDASLYGLFYFGMVPADDPQMVATMKAVRERLWCPTPVGGMARYEDDHYQRVAADGRPRVPGNPWFICTMWYAQWLVARARRPDELAEARSILEWVVARAFPSGVLAEQLDPYTGAPLSVSPLTWSHATAVSLVHEYLEKRRQLIS